MAQFNEMFTAIRAHDTRLEPIQPLLGEPLLGLEVENLPEDRSPNGLIEGLLIGLERLERLGMFRHGCMLILHSRHYKTERDAVEL